MRLVKGEAPASAPLTINLDLEGKPVKGNRSLTVYIYQAGTATLSHQDTPTTNLQDNLSLDLSTFTEDRYANYDIKIKVSGYLIQQVTNHNLIDTITFPQLEVGDLNNDHIINSLDWAQMQTNWYTANQQADLEIQLLKQQGEADEFLIKMAEEHNIVIDQRLDRGQQLSPRPRAGQSGATDLGRQRQDHPRQPRHRRA